MSMQINTIQFLLHRVDNKVYNYETIMGKSDHMRV